jgi:hypothetical protein
MTSPRETLVNPPWLDPETYISFLNRAFPGQWDRKAYDWYLGRTFNGVRGDLIIRAAGDRILAGLGVGHRQIRVADRTVDVCVISAAATLPGERGRGHYAALLQVALDRALEKRYPALLGFVTEDNGSGRGLMRLGSQAIPSFYVFSRARPRARALARPLRAERAERVGEQIARGLRRSHPAPEAHFHYEQADDWKRQLVQRPHAVRAVKWGHDSLALVETVGSTDRLQWLTCPNEKTIRSIAALAAQSASEGRRFFMYTLDGLVAEAAQRAGLKFRRGYLLLQPTGCSTADWKELAGAAWAVQSGDRI